MPLDKVFAMNRQGVKTLISGAVAAKPLWGGSRRQTSPATDRQVRPNQDAAMSLSSRQDFANNGPQHVQNAW